MKKREGEERPFESPDDKIAVLSASCVLRFVRFSSFLPSIHRQRHSQRYFGCGRCCRRCFLNRFTHMRARICVVCAGYCLRIISTANSSCAVIFLRAFVLPCPSIPFLCFFLLIWMPIFSYFWFCSPIQRYITHRVFVGILAFDCFYTQIFRYSLSLSSSCPFYSQWKQWACVCMHQAVAPLCAFVVVVVASSLCHSLHFAIKIEFDIWTSCCI